MLCLFRSQKNITFKYKTVLNYISTFCEAKSQKRRARENLQRVAAAKITEIQNRNEARAERAKGIKQMINNKQSKQYPAEDWSESAKLQLDIENIATHIHEQYISELGMTKKEWFCPMCRRNRHAIKHIGVCTFCCSVIVSNLKAMEPVSLRKICAVARVKVEFNRFGNTLSEMVMINEVLGFSISYPAETPSPAGTGTPGDVETVTLTTLEVAAARFLIVIYESITPPTERVFTMQL
jgi:hypothetical protein